MFCLFVFDVVEDEEEISRQKWMERKFEEVQCVVICWYQWKCGGKKGEKWAGEWDGDGMLWIDDIFYINNVILFSFFKQKKNTYFQK